jgi:hypothetical protein
MLFCLQVEGKRDQWCRLAISASQRLPQTGDRIDAVGWAKWSTRIIEILEVKLVS